MIFLDISFLFPYVSESDVDHERVCAVADEYRGLRLNQILVTTNHVVAETVTLLNKRGSRDPQKCHELATATGRQLFAGTIATIHHATPDEEREAFAHFTRHRDKRYSFCDCLSFVVMERLGIAEAWAVDSDFTHRFVARPGPA